MRGAGRDGAVVPAAAELSREVEGCAFDPGVETREELVRDEEYADLRRPARAELRSSEAGER